MNALFWRFLVLLLRRRKPPFKVVDEGDELLQSQAKRREILESFYGN